MRHGGVVDRRVLEVLGPHADDDVARLVAAAGRAQRLDIRSLSGALPNGSFTELPSRWPMTKFIDGEPMKPATNRFAGSS